MNTRCHSGRFFFGFVVIAAGGRPAGGTELCNVKSPPVPRRTPFVQGGTRARRDSIAKAEEASRAKTVICCNVLEQSSPSFKKPQLAKARPRPKKNRSVATRPPFRKKGKVLKNIPCKGAPQYHYNLYVPRRVEASEASPILFVFSPYGRAPVERFRAVAERFGWIICGSVEWSNRWRGAPPPAIYRALRAEMNRLFVLHPHRTYFAGMSGGARVSFALFRANPGHSAGVVGMAAGVMGNTAPKVRGGACVGTVGFTDMNYYEMVFLIEKMAEQGTAYRLIEWNGGHTWAPYKVTMEACDWLETQYYIRSPYLTPEEKEQRPKVLKAYMAKLKRLKPAMAAYECYEVLYRDLKPANREVENAMKQLLAKLKTSRKDELAARKAFRAASIPFDESVASFKALRTRMQRVAKDHPKTLYGFRANRVASTVEQQIQIRSRMRRWR